MIYTTADVNRAVRISRIRRRDAANGDEQMVVTASRPARPVGGERTRRKRILKAIRESERTQNSM